MINQSGTTGIKKLTDHETSTRIAEKIKAITANTLHFKNVKLAVAEKSAKGAKGAKGRRAGVMGGNRFSIEFEK